MKKTRRMTAVIAAMTLTAAMAVPNMMMTASAASIDITNISKDIEHTFEVYQIFTGTLATDGTFSNLTWGEGVTAYNGTTVNENGPELVAPAIVDTVSGMSATALIEAVKENTIQLSSEKETMKSDISTGTASISDLADGYYLVKDVTNLAGKDDANSAWILQVAGTAKIEIKNAKPTVDKQILDETTDAEKDATNGWGESADHAINEKFQFKLTATIPADADYAAYETYKLVFNDTLSKGITFDQIDSVKATSTTLTGTNAKTLATTDYTKSDIKKDTDTGDQTWTLTIANIKSIVDTNTLGTDNTTAKPIFGKEVITVEVLYTAHLNEEAVVSSADGTGVKTNNNKVNLTYSNNPNTDGTGTTADDYVWCFTYGVNNTKYQVDAKEGNELAGAKFTLYASDKTTAIPMKLIDSPNGIYAVPDQSSTNTVMISDANGVFNIKGLDAGTYYLVEIEPPTGYNKAADTKIVIGATHKESATVNGADLTMENSPSDLNNKIVDTKNNSLPSTGGMGTLFFRLGGGVSAALVGVYLVSKKRAKKETAE